MLRTPPKDGEAGNLPQVQSEPKIPAVIASSPSTSYISVRYKRPRTECSPNSDYHLISHESTTNELLDIIRQKIRSVLSTEVSASIKTCITNELREIKEMFRDLEHSVNFMSADYDPIKIELDACKSGNKSLRKDNELLKTTVSELSLQVTRNLIEQN